MTSLLTTPPPGEGLSDPVLEIAGQRVLELLPERQTVPDAEQGQVDAHHAPAIGVGLLQQTLQHLGSLWRWLVGHGLKMVANSAPLNGFALRSLHGPKVREAATLYRALAPSRKKLALALGIDESNASRLLNGDTPTMLARFCDDMDRLLEAGIDPAPLLAYASRRLAEKRAAMIARLYPGLRRVS